MSFYESPPSSLNTQNSSIPNFLDLKIVFSLLVATEWILDVSSSFLLLLSVKLIIQKAFNLVLVPNLKLLLDFFRSKHDSIVNMIILYNFCLLLSIYSLLLNLHNALFHMFYRSLHPLFFQSSSLNSTIFIHVNRYFNFFKLTSTSLWEISFCRRRLKFFNSRLGIFPEIILILSIIVDGIGLSIGPIALLVHFNGSKIFGMLISPTVFIRST